ncbi:hypothetical protein M0811_00167 [Anaeramoeba ignava]|uniref:Uncharacterized protein n=1 Tax=Anaeramoeba ignava TaxID=1746090 RepID=A0A9Q0LQS5_ANAIG|nr:hypothetical protein M0811_00167 [Anaeramoeba ignava]
MIRFFLLLFILFLSIPTLQNDSTQIETLEKEGFEVDVKKIDDNTRCPTVDLLTSDGEVLFSKYKSGRYPHKEDIFEILREFLK